MTLVEIRRKILKALYDYNKENSPYAMKASDLIKNTGISNTEEFRWNINYLMGEGYVKFGNKIEWGRQIISSGINNFTDKPITKSQYKSISLFKITTKGINLIEDPSEFNRRFPDIQIQVNLTIENFIINIKKAVDASDLPLDKKQEILDEVNNFLSNPIINPFVGYALLKLFGLG